MTKTVERFDYELLTDGNRLLMPLATIVLKSNTRTEDGRIGVSPQMTELEIDTNIELLKADLDTVGKRAKTAIKRAKQRQKSG